MVDLVRYGSVGLTSLTVFCLLGYFAPFVVILSLVGLFVGIMSLAIGYVIVDTYDQWRKDEQNKSRKTATSSANDKQGARY
jgi:hypothetical protein